MWYKGVELLNGEVIDGDEVVNNTIDIGPLDRSHRNAEFLCQATNSKRGPIVSKSIKLDVLCK